MTFILEGLIYGSGPLAIMYLCLAIFVGRKMLSLQNLYSTHYLNASKLFVMNLFLSSILRVMSFGLMTVLDLAEIAYSNPISSNKIYYDDLINGTEEVFEKALFVLFDFPDFCFMSAYALILVIWAETYLESRKHWLSSYTFRRVWMLSYLIFNILLYSAQLGLYSMLFWPTVNKRVLSDMIYLTLTAFNLGIPIIGLASYFFLNLRFAGFPFSSRYAKQRVKNLTFVVGLWTLTRLIWGLAALTSVIEGWITVIEQSSSIYTLFLVLLFLVTEIAPMLYSLQLDILGSLAERRPSSTNLHALDSLSAGNDVGVESGYQFASGFSHQPDLPAAIGSSVLSGREETLQNTAANAAVTASHTHELMQAVSVARGQPKRTWLQFFFGVKKKHTSCEANVASTTGSSSSYVAAIGDKRDTAPVSYGTMTKLRQPLERQFSSSTPSIAAPAAAPAPAGISNSTSSSSGITTAPIIDQHAPVAMPAPVSNTTTLSPLRLASMLTTWLMSPGSRSKLSHRMDDLDGPENSGSEHHRTSSREGRHDYTTARWSHSFNSNQSSRSHSLSFASAKSNVSSDSIDEEIANYQKGHPTRSFSCSSGSGGSRGSGDLGRHSLARESDEWESRSRVLSSWSLWG